MLLCAALLLASCSSEKKATKDFDAGTETEVGATASIKRGVKPEPDAEVAVLDVDPYGKIVIELYPNIAPEMVKRFKQLAREGFYNGTTFHRINPNIGIIQGGDPNSKDDDPSNDGAGDSPYPNVPAEFSDIPYDKGIVGAARRAADEDLSEAQANDTANCQFFITLKRQPAFDKQYTVFGRIIEGLNNAQVISTAPLPTGGGEHPAEKIIIKSVTIEKR
ncbi:MAG: peptidylprolyl isomerase [Pyrinomonadaceae bacterium]